MLIPIIFNSSTSSKLPSTLAKISNDEVVLIELQGMLEVEVAQPTDKNGKLVGKLTINEDESGKPTLLIGPHLLEGTINTLNKPLAVLTRFLADANPTTSTTTIAVMSPFDLEDQGKDTMEVDDDKNNGKDQLSTAPLTPSTKWEAVGIVKRKIVFAKRPMPVVSRPS